MSVISHQFASLLNAAQRRAVLTHDGPVLIIAGAGSGKTRVITFRIASMLAAGIPETAILAVTFTNKAAAEMRHRIRELTGKKAMKLTIATFHAFGLQLLRENHALIGYRRDFSIYDETDRESLIKDLAHDLRLDLRNIAPSSIAYHFSRVKTGLAGWTNAFAAFEGLYAEYNHSLQLFNAFDFDDLIVTPLRMLREHPEVLESGQERYRYIMVDEFQDTSDIQYQFITLLAKKYGNICVVGDDDQSIYSFRGAHFENLLRLEKDFPGVLEIKLEENYRSSKTILNAANALIANNKERKPKALCTSRGAGEPITLSFLETESEEGHFIAGTIREVAQKFKTHYRDIGILLRTNHLTRPIEEALLAGRIPYKVSGGMSFFSRKEVKDILSYLAVIANPSDDVNLLRIINTPRRGIGKAVMVDLVGFARKHHTSLFHSLQQITAAEHPDFPHPKARTSIAALLASLDACGRTMKEKKGLAAGLRELVQRIDYWAYLLTQYKKEQVARFKYMNVENLVNSLADYEEDPQTVSPGLRDYLHRINLLSMEENKDEEEADKVNLMTVHAAKGLEFETVFIAGAEEGLFPHQRSVEEQNDSLEEERRLFYVALTRARRKLYISAARTRRRMGVALESSPSQFIEELPQELCETFQPQAPDETEVASYFSELKDKFK